MPDLLLTLSLFAAVLQCVLGYLFLHRIWRKRFAVLERNLQQLSDVMCQMAEIQMKSYQKLNGNLGDVEERIMDLALPSDDSGHQLERRHHVLALDRKGIPIDEIVKRLDLPRSEVELVLNLRKFVDQGASATGKAAKAGEEVKRHAQA